MGIGHSREILAALELGLDFRHFFAGLFLRVGRGVFSQRHQNVRGLDLRGLFKTALVGLVPFLSIRLADALGLDQTARASR